MSVARLGDRALRLELPPAIDRAALRARLSALSGAIDVVLTDRYAAVIFDRAPPTSLGALDLAALASSEIAPEVTVRVAYDGPDLAEIAARCDTTADAWADAHARAEHTCAFLGFLPGFAYLRGIAPALSAPRRATPRARVEAGSLAIAGPYTGIYPFASPGGWNLVGRVIDFAPFRDGRAAISVGARVRLVRDA